MNELFTVGAYKESVRNEIRKKLISGNLSIDGFKLNIVSTNKSDTKIFDSMFKKEFHDIFRSSELLESQFYDYSAKFILNNELVIKTFNELEKYITALEEVILCQNEFNDYDAYFEIIIKNNNPSQEFTDETLDNTISFIADVPAYTDNLESFWQDWD